MGDAAGQHAQALQLLGVEQAALELEALLLGPPALGDVAHDGQQVRPRAQLDAGEADLGVEGRAVRARVEPLEDLVLAGQGGPRIFSADFSAESRPSCCRGGENRAGAAPTISSRVQPKTSSVRELQSTNRPSRIRKMASSADSNSVR